MIEPWRVGQKVKRRQDVFARHGAWMHGVVVERYAGHGHDELYRVRWENIGRKKLYPPTFEGGFLRHGLKADGPR